MEGRDGAIFAYGQTGSGKTHLMEGVLDSSRSEWGIVPFVVRFVLPLQLRAQLSLGLCVSQAAASDIFCPTGNFKGASATSECCPQ